MDNRTIDDYALARDLLAPIFNAIQSDGLTDIIRQTVEAVGNVPDIEVTETDLGQGLKLSKSTVHYRVQRAIRGGWLVNLETRKGRPARLTRGAPLPEKTASLPEPSRVQEVFDGSNRFEGGGRMLTPPQTLKIQALARRGSTIRTKKGREEMFLFFLIRESRGKYDAATPF